MSTMPTPDPLVMANQLRAPAPPDPPRPKYRVPDPQFYALLRSELRRTRIAHLIRSIQPMLLTVIWFLMTSVLIFNVPYLGADFYPTDQPTAIVAAYVLGGAIGWLLWAYVLARPLRMDLILIWKLRNIPKSEAWHIIQSAPDQIRWVYPGRERVNRYRIVVATRFYVHFQIADQRYLHIHVRNMESAVALTQGIGERASNAKVGFDSL